MYSLTRCLWHQPPTFKWGRLCQVWPIRRVGRCRQKAFLVSNISLTSYSWSVNLGPVSPVLTDVKPNPEFTGLGYNPRCLRRDISKVASSGWTKDSDVASLIKNSKDFLSFTTTMQGDFPNGFLGVHTGGHFTIGGDPGGDLFASPGDPAFFLHHGMIDRTYWTWQNQDLANRQYALAGTITLNNQPPSRNTSLDDVIDLGYVGVPVVTIRDASNTLAGPFCYVYA
jgi:tyrosinase